MTYTDLRDAIEAGPTEGPWDFRQVYGSGARCSIKARNGIVRIASISVTNTDFDANAKFIAAANPSVIRRLLDERDALEKDARRLQDYRNWLMLAFRAMNEADGVLVTIEPDDNDEAWRLAELRARLEALAIQVPTLLGMRPAEVDAAIASSGTQGDSNEDSRRA